MFPLKHLTAAALPSALAKAERYRLLNEPEQAESICRDILAVDPAHQAALTTLLLALTDQFDAQSHEGVGHAEEALARLSDEYQRSYLAGIIRERWARALLRGGDPGRQAYEWLLDAMADYDRAAPLAQAGNEEALLRWNACARTITRHDLRPQLRPEAFDHGD